MSHTRHICFERILPSGFEAAGTKFWPPGSTLRIAFLDGDPVVHRNVERTARTWLRYANLHFDFLPTPDPMAHIRISFQGTGSWSAIGLDALRSDFYLPGQPTMNYRWLTPESTLDEYYVVLHEFGHALGLVHEHQSPASGLNWDRAAVIEDLSGYPDYWSVETIEHNVLNKYGSGTVTQYTAFDPASIMVYPIPSTWTLDGQDFPTNRTLSSTDIAFIRQAYPPNPANG